MDVRITPKHLSGTVTPPPSKSQAHRLLIAAALAGGVSTVRGVAMSQDVEATLRCLTALGGRWRETAPGVLEISGIGGRRLSGDLPRLDCGESGSTLRFFLPIALAVAGGGVFTGRGRLMERPQGPYFDLFREKDIFFAQKDGVLTVRGQLTPGEYRLPGNVSSQFFTGLLFALPLLDGPSTIVPTTAVESRDYIRMTLDALTGAGVTAQEPQAPGGAFRVSPAAYQPFDRTVEADWSQAAFWYAAIALGSRVEPEGLNAFSVQGDMAVVPHFLRLTHPGDLDIDLSGIPDLLPPLAVMAAVRSGTTRFVHAARLRMKESDRLETTAAMLSALGASAQTGPDFLTVTGGSLAGGTVDGANDHRIVMAAAIAATACAGPVTIRGAEAVRQSYPDFWEVYQSLGGDVHVL